MFRTKNFTYVTDRSHGRYSVIINSGLSGLGFCYALGREKKVDWLTMWPPAMVNSQTLLPRLTLPERWLNFFLFKFDNLQPMDFRRISR